MRSRASAARTRACSSRSSTRTTRPLTRAGSARCACAPLPSCRATGTTKPRPRPRSPRDGFVRTGDLGWLDDRGRLHLVGRSKEMYVRGGYNVYPVEVEAVLSNHPALAAVAVVPRSDLVMGEVGVAVLVPRDPAHPPTLDELQGLRPGRVGGVQAPGGRARRGRAPAHRDGEDRPSRPLRDGGEGRGSIVSPHLWNSTSPTTKKNCATRSGPCSSRSRRSRSHARSSSTARGPRRAGARSSRSDGPRSPSRRRTAASGSGPIEGAILAEELGRQLTPGPLLPTVTQFVPAVRETGARPRNGRAGSPPSRPASARARSRSLERDGSFDPAATHDATADRRHRRRADRREALRRSKATPSTRSSSSARDDDRGRRRRARRRRAGRPRRRCTPVRALDGSRRLVARPPRRRARLRATACSVTARRRPPALRRAVEEATVALALEMVGTAQTIFDVTLEYAKQRVQFGVPIGSFQATKHKFADMLIALERARSTGYFAALTLAEDDAAPHHRRVGGQGRCRRLPAAARQGRHPDPRRHRLHVGARHAALREAHQVERAALRDEPRGTAPVSPTRSASSSRSRR